jgi:hypothetical protein
LETAVGSKREISSVHYAPASHNQRAGTKPKLAPLQEPAGEAAGLAAGLASGAAADAAGLASSEAAADAEASGEAGVSSDLVQAAAKNIEIRARIRTLRITTSFVTSALVKRAEFETALGYCTSALTSS